MPNIKHIDTNNSRSPSTPTKPSSAFTIVELLVAIVVIAILAAITIVSYTGISSRAINSSVKSDIVQAYKQLEISKTTSSTDVYPINLAVANLKSSNGTTYSYYSDSPYKNYCLEATNNSTVYSVSSSNPAPIAGNCLTNGLVGYWALDNVTGMTDLSPNGNNGTANGGISIGTATNHLGVANKATSFDGVDDSVIVPSTSFVPLSTTAYSISLWIWDDTPIGSLSTYHRIISWANGSNSTNLQFGLGLGNGLAVRMFYLTYGSANAVAMTSGDIPNGWNHGVVTYDGSVYRMYVNGDLRSQNAYTRNDIGLYAVSALYIGQRGNGAGVIGSIADTRIYNRALSQAEITQLYNSN